MGLRYALGATLLILTGCAAYRLPYRFTAMEQQWILEARQQGYPVTIRCSLHGRPDNRWPVNTQQHWCLIEAGGKWIADISSDDARRAKRAAEAVKP